MIDARIPLMAAQGSQVNLVDMYRQKQAMDMQRQQMEMQREQMEFQKALQEANINAEKAKAMKEGVKDMHAAVRWADSPEKWAQVQQHYGQYDPQLASIPFEQREQALLKLGQLGEYLDKNQEKFQAIEPGGSLYGISPDGNVREVVRANPGNAAPASPVGSVQEGATATNPQTGEKIIFRNGAWQPMGGTAGNGGGGFPTGQ